MCLWWAQLRNSSIVPNRHLVAGGRALCYTTRMIKRIHHIGIAVADLPAALNFYVDALGLSGEQYRETMAAQKISATFIPIGSDDCEFELLEPLGSEEGLVHKFLAKRGPGVHHICLETDDIEATLAELKAKGLELIDEHARNGARGHKVAFINPHSTGGVLIELLQHSD
jgi:methylmalonyl-CoA/ethylmalonyl-CoA epimerase